ncbi:MAG: redoxin family protein [Chitinophagaceae bacterium]
MIQKFKFNFLLPILTVIILFASCKSNNDKHLEAKIKSLSDNIGDNFKINNVLDSSGKEVQLDFSKSDVTIIDFWFDDCPPCINEMSQFSNLLAGKEGKISVISISINPFWVWKPYLLNPNGRLSFLNNNTSNWTQYVLYTPTDEKLKNTISVDRQKQLRENFNVRFFPAYFVVDKKGIIKERPESAVEFIKKYN